MYFNKDKINLKNNLDTLNHDKKTHRVKPRTHERAEPVMQCCTRGTLVRVDSI
jgi:hypothetical protein